MTAEKNLATHRLTNWSEISHYLEQTTKDEFLVFLNNAYKMLMNLYPGDQIVIEDDVHPENRKRFIQVGCMFIMENHPDYEFTDDYSIIRRLKENPEDIIKQISIQFTQKRNLKNELERTSGANNNTAQREKNNPGNRSGNQCYWIRP